MKNKLLKIILIIILLISIVCIIVLLNNKLNDSNKNKQNASLPINYVHPFYAYNFTTIEEIIGVTDYTFVAKINSIKRTKVTYTPYTIYDVTVIENIKGELVKDVNIEIEQSGGLEKNGKSYTFPVGMGLLNVGEYYIFSALASGTDGSLGIDHQKLVIPLGNINNEQEFNKIKEVSSLNSVESVKDKKLEYSNFKSDALEKVLEYKEASFNQVVPDDKPTVVKSTKYDIAYRSK